MKYTKSPMLFDCFDPDCGAALIIAVAEALSAGLSTDQMNVLGTFLAAVADTISYMAAQISYNKDTCSNKGSKNEETKDDSNGTDTGTSDSNSEALKYEDISNNNGSKDSGNMNDSKHRGSNKGQDSNKQRQQEKRPDTGNSDDERNNK